MGGLAHEPIVVGGTAEDFWTADEYHQTDLDLVARPLTDETDRILERVTAAQAAPSEAVG